MFGRVYLPDDRDKLFPGSRLHRVTGEKSRYWPTFRQPDEEGSMPYAPGYAWLFWLQSQQKRLPRKPYLYSPYDFYKPGEVLGGSGATIRGGAKFLKDEGILQSYWWTKEFKVMTNYLINFAPVIIGSSWMEGMMDADFADATISATGEIVGNHAYLIDGINLRVGFVRVKNSWGQSWGRSGRAFLPIADMNKILSLEDTEVCLPWGAGKRWYQLREKAAPTGRLAHA